MWPDLCLLRKGSGALHHGNEPLLVTGAARTWCCITTCLCTRPCVASSRNEPSIPTGLPGSAAGPGPAEEEEHQTVVSCSEKPRQDWSRDETSWPWTNVDLTVGGAYSYFLFLKEQLPKFKCAEMCSPSGHTRLGWVCFFIRFGAMSQQRMLCSEWVPSEWESDKHITIIHTTPVHQLTSGEDKLKQIQH